MQPYASLLALGHKRIETKSFDTDYRGEILIHSSTARLGAARLLANNSFNGLIGSVVSKIDVHPRTAISCFDCLVFGAVIGKATLCHTLPMHSFINLHGGQLVIGEGPYLGLEFSMCEREKSLNNFSLDRYAYFFTRPIMFDEPIAARGRQWLWDFDHCKTSRIL